MRGTHVPNHPVLVLNECAPPGEIQLLVFYRGTSLTNRDTPLGLYRRPMHRVLGGSQGGRRFLMGEVPLYGPGLYLETKSWIHHCIPTGI